MFQFKPCLRIAPPVLLLFIWSLAGAAFATSLTKKTFVCPVHGHEYQDFSLGSTNTLGGQDSEFRTYAVGKQPLAYFIHTSPNCGAPDAGSLFPPGGSKSNLPLTPQEKNQITNCVDLFCKTNKADPKTFTASQKYALLANIFIVRGLPSLKIAETYIFAAWAADDEQNDKSSKTYRLLAIDFMIKALDEKEVEPEKIPRITYLIGEFNRRIGRFAQALEWFARVKTDNLELERLCNQQKALADKKESQKIMIILPDKGK